MQLLCMRTYLCFFVRNWVTYYSLYSDRYARLIRTKSFVYSLTIKLLLSINILKCVYVYQQQTIVQAYRLQRRAQKLSKQLLLYAHALFNGFFIFAVKSAWIKYLGLIYKLKCIISITNPIRLNRLSPLLWYLLQRRKISASTKLEYFYKCKILNFGVRGRIFTSTFFR